MQELSGQGRGSSAAVGQLELLEDAALVAEVGGGSHEAFAELYERHFGELYDYAARIVRDRDTAADVVQTAFTRAWERAQVDTQIGNARAWLYRVTHNAAIDEVRRRGKLDSGSGDAESGGFDFAALEDPTSADPATQLIEQEVADLVWTTAAALSPQDYALLDLHVRRDLDADELAEELGVTPGALYTRLSRLRRTFEEALTVNLLVRTGRADCDELDELVAGLEVPTGSPAGRRAVQAHASDCETCQESRQRYVTAGQILAGFATVPAMHGVQEAVWLGISGAIGAGAGGTPPPANGSEGTIGAAAGAAGAIGAASKIAAITRLPAALHAGLAAVVVAAVAIPLALVLSSGAAQAHDPKYVWSPSHDAGVSSSDRTVSISWSRQPDALGYSVTWTHQPRQEPDAVRDLPGSALGTTSPALSPGRWFFHLRTESRSHAWTHTVHRGPYVILAGTEPSSQGPPSPDVFRPPPASAPGADQSSVSQPGDTSGGGTSPGGSDGAGGSGGSGSDGDGSGGAAGGTTPPGADSDGSSGGGSSPSPKDSSPPAAPSIELDGGPYFSTPEVRLVLRSAVRAGAGTGVVERSVATSKNGSCVNWSDWSGVSLRSRADAQVGDGHCYRYRYRVGDEAGNLSPFSAPSDAAIVDTTPPGTPVLSVSESGDASLADGTTLYYRPGADGGSFTVSATAADGGSGVSGFGFPGLAGGFNPATNRRVSGAHATASYNWTTGGTAAGAKVVTAYDRAGNTGLASFVIAPDSAAPTGASAAVTGGPWFKSGVVPVQATAGFDAGSGVDPQSLVVERDSAPLADGSCGAFGAAWAAVSLQDGADRGVDGGRCYRYRVKVADRVGNVAMSDATDPARVDISPPSATLRLTESSRSLYVDGTTLYYRPGADDGAFTVHVDAADADSGIRSVTFPAADGASGGGVDTAFPYEEGYDLSGDSNASGVQVVTTANGAGLTTDVGFTLTPDSEGPRGLAVKVAADWKPGEPVPLKIDLGSDSGSGVDQGSLAVERDYARATKGGCGEFPGAWTRVKLTNGADSTAAQLGCYRYRIRVSDNVGNDSKSQPSNAAIQPETDSSPPSELRLTLSEDSASLFVSDTTLFFRPGSPGEHQFSIAAKTDDPESGIDHVTFPNLNGAKGGGIDSSAPYEEVYSFTGSMGGGTETVTATNGAGLTTGSDFAVVADKAEPSGVSVDLIGGPRYRGSVPLAVDRGQDSDSGIDPGSVFVERESSSYDGKECGPYKDSWQTVRLDDDKDTDVQSGKCYRYRLSVSDNVGNQAVSRPTESAILDAETASNLDSTVPRGRMHESLPR